MTFSPKDVNSALSVLDRSMEANDGPEYVLAVQIDSTRPAHRLFRCIMAIEHRGETLCVERNQMPPYYVSTDQIIQVIMLCARRAHEARAGFFKCRMFVDHFWPGDEPNQKVDPCDLDFVITPDIDLANLFQEIYDKVSAFFSNLRFVGHRGQTLDELSEEDHEEFRVKVNKTLSALHQQVTIYGACQGVAVPTMDSLREGDGLGFLVPKNLNE